MKYIKICIITVLLCIVGTIKAQKNTTNNDKYFDKIIKTEFKSLVTGGDITAPGKFASFDVTNNKISLSTYFNFKNTDLLNISASGSSVNKTLFISNNSKLNTGINISAEYHCLSKSKRDFIVEDLSIIYEIKARLNKLKNTHEYEVWKIRNNVDIVDLEVQIEKMTRQIDEYESQLRVLVKNKHNKKGKNSEEDALIDLLIQEYNKLDALVVKLNQPVLKKEVKRIYIKEIISVENNINSKLSELTDIQIQEIYLKKIQDYFLNEQKKKELKELKTTNSSKRKKPLDRKLGVDTLKIYKELKPKVTRASSFSWLSFGAGITNNSYNLLDKSQLFTEQIKKEDNVNWELKGQYSGYGWTDKLTTYYFWNFGTIFSVGDNITSLNKVNIEEISQTGTEASLIRQTTSEIIAYTGDFESSILRNSFYGNYYRFFSNRKFGFHLNTNTNILEGAKPIWNSEVGLIVSFFDKEKKESTINIELFYAFNDIGNSLDIDKGLFERNNIGLRLAVPINF